MGIRRTPRHKTLYAKERVSYTEKTATLLLSDRLVLAYSYMKGYGRVLCTKFGPVYTVATTGIQTVPHPGQEPSPPPATRTCIAGVDLGPLHGIIAEAVVVAVASSCRRTRQPPGISVYDVDLSSIIVYRTSTNCNAMRRAASIRATY